MCTVRGMQASAAERQLRRCRQPTCTRLNGLRFSLRPGHEEVARGKYTTELRAAVAHAIALRTPGARYAPGDHDTHAGLVRAGGGFGAGAAPPSSSSTTTAASNIMIPTSRGRAMNLRAKRLRERSFATIPPELLLPTVQATRLVVAVPSKRERLLNATLQRVLNKRARALALADGYVEVRPQAQPP